MDPHIKKHLRRGEVHFQGLRLEDIAALVRENEAAYYFLIAAAKLNRTLLKKAMLTPAAQIPAKPLRKAHVIKEHLPVRELFELTATKAIALREHDLWRKGGGSIEALFRDRLKTDGIPIAMSPPVPSVPGLLIARRKPDGVYPDPKTGQAPKLYLEVKNVRRLADDIQKRLYEIAEASLEMKTIYGNLKLEGLGLTSTKDVEDKSPELRARLRTQITASAPVVIALLLCSKVGGERYREGAQAFVDRVFFEEEIEECLTFLKDTIRACLTA